jgi:tRNA U34 5-carboxymethylaminomethyl modifying enzyme MnmG/GidA
MPTGSLATVARRYHTSQAHYLRKTVNWNDAGIAAGVLFGTLPQGAQITYIHINITTAFNALTTNVLAAGTALTGAQVFGTADAAAGTAGSKIPNAAGMALAPLAADTPIYVSYTQTGTAATAGVATITIEYSVDNG